MISLSKFKESSNKIKTEKNRNKKMMKILDKLIQCNPEEYEVLEDIRIDLVEKIPLSSLKKEMLKKAIKKFKETKTKTVTKDKEENVTFVNTSKIKDCKVFVYNVKNTVNTLVSESEKLKSGINDSNSKLIMTAKNELQYDCKVVFSEILQIQNELEIQVDTLNSIQTKLAIIDEQIKRDKS